MTAGGDATGDPDDDASPTADADTADSAQGHVALLDAARTQVITLAADLLGRMPADEVPASLRAFARFARPKRLRLGSPQIAAALDADESFRAAVAQPVVAASPDLAAAVREGRPTAAADPLDVAVLAYLTRPDGWQDVLRAANARWAAERGGGAGELTRLREQAAELRSQLRAERGRSRRAVAEATDAATAELAAARQAVRDRTRELRALERERDDARRRADEARAELERAVAAFDAERRRLQSRLTEAQRSAEAGRRESRTDRELEDARLWLLLDTLVQAAAGLRRELPLPAPSVRPADALAAATGAIGAGTGDRRAADDPAALDRLLALPNVHVIVDGYNVTKTGYGDLALAEQRTRLITSLAALRARSGTEITIAFDGGEKPPAQPPVPRGLRVLFSRADVIADDLIRELVAAEPAGRPILVVTSDAQIVRDVTRAGAWTVPSAVLLARLG